MSRNILSGLGQAQYNASPPVVGQPQYYTNPGPGQPPAGQNQQYARPVPNPPSFGQPQNTFPNSPPPPQARYPGTANGPPRSQTQTGNGYAPVQFDSEYGGPDPQQFYGMLIDASHRPSEVFCRLADALFFYMDQNSEIYPNTQLIEPAKYGWFMRAIGLDPFTVGVCESILAPLYDGASVPYTIQKINGAQIPVLDRRGWLHLAVFEARASPGETHTHWSKMLNLLRLQDPARNAPFPTPIPRSAFPAIQDFSLNSVYTNWQIQLVTAVTTQRTQATISQYTNSATSSYAALLGGFGAGGLGLGAGLGAGPGAGQPQDLQSLEIQQKIESDKKTTSMINAGVSILSTVMGGGPIGGFGTS